MITLFHRGRDFQLIQRIYNSILGKVSGCRALMPQPLNWGMGEER